MARQLVVARSRDKRGPLAERLETRRLYAVTVAQSYPGFYEVNGDDAANVIAVSVSQADQTFTLDGVTYPNVSCVTVNGQGGDDHISVASDGWGSIGAAANGGDGNDTIALNIDGIVHGDAGDDTLTLCNSFMGEVYGDDGNDNVFVEGDCIAAQIDGGAGNDLIDASQNNFSVTLHGGAGNDTLFGSDYDDELYGDGGNDVMYGGAGNNTFYSTGGVVYGGRGGNNVAFVPSDTYVPCYDVQFVYQW